MVDKTKKQKMKQIGEIRAIKRISKYIEKLNWSYSGSVDTFTPKMFNMDNKRNTKDYFQSMSFWFEQFFRELFGTLDGKFAGYGETNEQTEFYNKFREQLKEQIDD